jgi:hypothetical protein
MRGVTRVTPKLVSYGVRLLYVHALFFCVCSADTYVRQTATPEAYEQLRRVLRTTHPARAVGTRRGC